MLFLPSMFQNSNKYTTMRVHTNLQVKGDKYDAMHHLQRRNERTE